MSAITRRVSLVAVALVLILGGWWIVISLLTTHKPNGSGGSATANKKTSPVAAATIHINDNAFEPVEITISKGQTVRFINDGSRQHWPASNDHPTHDIYPEFDPKRGLDPGESWSFTFDRAGTWRMHDHLAPYIKGKITVN